MVGRGDYTWPKVEEWARENYPGFRNMYVPESCSPSSLLFQRNLLLCHLSASAEVALTSPQLALLSDTHLAQIIPKLRIVARAVPSDKARVLVVARARHLLLASHRLHHNDRYRDSIDYPRRFTRAFAKQWNALRLGPAMPLPLPSPALRPMGVAKRGHGHARRPSLGLSVGHSNSAGFISTPTPLHVPLSATHPPTTPRTPETPLSAPRSASGSVSGSGGGGTPLLRGLALSPARTRARPRPPPLNTSSSGGAGAGGIAGVALGIVSALSGVRHRHTNSSRSRGSRGLDSAPALSGPRSWGSRGLDVGPALAASSRGSRGRRAAPAQDRFTATASAFTAVAAPAPGDSDGNAPSVFTFDTAAPGLGLGLSAPLPAPARQALHRHLFWDPQHARALPQQAYTFEAVFGSHPAHIYTCTQNSTSASSSGDAHPVDGDGCTVPYVVGMLGDGINDVAALQRADVGIAMGSATAVTRDAADLVLLDDNLGSVVAAVSYGRTIFKAIRKFIVFQCTVNAVALAVSVLGPFLGFDMPLTLPQLLWVNLIMDTFAALAFGGEPAQPEYLLEKPVHRYCDILSPRMRRSIVANGLFVAAVAVAFLTVPAVGRWFGREAQACGASVLALIEDTGVAGGFGNSDFSSEMPVFGLSAPPALSLSLAGATEVQGLAAAAEGSTGSAEADADTSSSPSAASPDTTTPTPTPDSTSDSDSDAAPGVVFLTAFFGVFVVTCTVHALSVRAGDHPCPWAGVRQNKLFSVIIPAILAGQVLLTSVPPLARVLRTVPLTVGEWAIVALPAVLVLFFDFMRKKYFLSSVSTDDLINYPEMFAELAPLNSAYRAGRRFKRPQVHLQPPEPEVQKITGFSDDLGINEEFRGPLLTLSPETIPKLTFPDDGLSLGSPAVEAGAALAPGGLTRSLTERSLAVLAER
jgi:hypothetical protein